MHLLVRSIDFVDKTVTIEGDRPFDVSGFERLARFLGCCSDLGFSKVELRHGVGLSPAFSDMLEKIEKTKRLPKITLVREGEDTPPTAAPDRPGCTGGRRGDEESVEYRFVFANLSTVLDDLTSAVLLAGLALPLDDRTLARLRLCLYELAANTVEHGEFGGEPPEIRVRIVAEKSRIAVEYEDNAGAFPTAHSESIDIGERIKGRSKRGLGLILLDRMATSLRYERKTVWNHTRFTITRTNQVVCDLHRRLDMNELAITVTRTESRDTVVLKPAGSINSSTVAQLDASINDLVHQGHTTIVLDLSVTDFISSSGVGLLVGTVAAIREQNGDLVLMNLPKLVNDIFDVLNIKMHFRIIKDLSELKAGTRS